MDLSKSSLFCRSSSNGAFGLHQAPLLDGLFGTREFNPRILNHEANQGDSITQQGSRPQGLFDSVDVVSRPIGSSPDSVKSTPQPASHYEKDIRKEPSHDSDIFFLENFIFPTPAQVAQDMFRREGVALPKAKPAEQTKPKAQAKPKPSKLALPKTGVNKKTIVRLKKKPSTQETEVKGEDKSIDEEMSKPHMEILDASQGDLDQKPHDSQMDIKNLESHETVQEDPDEPESSQEDIQTILSRISARLNPQPGCSCFKDNLEQPKQATRRPRKKVKKDLPRQYVTLNEEDSSDDQFPEPLVTPKKPVHKKIFKCVKKPRVMPNRKRMAMKEKCLRKGPAVPKKKRAAVRRAKATLKRSMHAVSAPQGGIPWLPLPDWLWPKDEPNQDKPNQD